MASVSFEKLCIRFSALEEGVTTFEFSKVHPELSEGDRCRFPHEIKAEVKVTVVGEDYLFELKVKSRGELVCDRCGVQFQKNMEGEVKTLFTYDPARAQGEEMGDVRILPPGAEGIDFSQDAMDAIVLAIPSKCLCHEDCLGLCSNCGANLNEKSCSCKMVETDPRWEALKDLKFEDG